MKVLSFVFMIAFSFSLLGCVSESESSNPVVISINSSVSSLEEAKAYALLFSHLDADDVEFTRKEMIGSDGYNICQLEYKSGSNEYKCYINADTGVVIKYDFDGYLPKTGTVIGHSEITSLLKKFAPDIDEDTVDMDRDNSNDDGLMVYEGVASSDTYDYSFEIHATSGTVVEWKSTMK